MNQQAFLNLRPQMLNDQCRECFDILSPYFPTVTYDSPVILNLQGGYKQGGTGIVNYSMIPAEALSVVDTLKEIGCGCLFVCPVPVSDLFSEEYLGTGQGSTGFAHRVLEQNKAAFLGNWIKFPPYFSVHMVGASHKASCRAQLKELLVQNLVVRKPSAATTGIDEVERMLSKFTLTNRS